MKSTLKFGIAIGVLSMAAFGAAQAESGRTFTQLDRNQDSLVSISEAQVDDDVRASFPKADINGDGYVSRREFSDWRADTGPGTSTTAPRSNSPDAVPPGPQNNPEIDSPRSR